MLTTADHHAAWDWLASARRPLLVSHRRPDGDALGAIAALGRSLTGGETEARAVLFEPLPARYGLLEELVAWRRWDQQRDALTAECDALVILDTCAHAQLEPLADFLPRAPRILVIDHHPTRDPIGTRPGDRRLLDDTAGATCLIITELLRAAGRPLDAPTATALLTGLATDCGWFRFSNTDARLLRAAAGLVEAGAPLPAVYRQIHEQDSPARLRLIARMLASLELLAAGRVAVVRLRRADYAAAGADDSMSEDLVNEVGRLAGLEVMLLFNEEADGRVRVNLRSKRDVDVSQIAALFGGGGHARAAGARLNGSFDEAERQVTAAVLKALEG